MSKNDLDLFLSMLARMKAGGNIHHGQGHTDYVRAKRLANKVANQNPQYVLLFKRNWDNDLDELFEHAKSLKQHRG
jgi:hypothetical protein